MGSEGQSFGHTNIEQLRAITAKITAMPRQPTVFIAGTEYYLLPLDECAAIASIQGCVSMNFPDWQRKKYFGNRGRKR